MHKKYQNMYYAPFLNENNTNGQVSNNTSKVALNHLYV